jgi:hypothetical protein
MFNYQSVVFSFFKEEIEDTVLLAKKKNLRETKINKHVWKVL